MVYDSRKFLNKSDQGQILDIIVTTPKGERLHAATEARECIAAGGGLYMRTLKVRPNHVAPGSYVFYVDDGFITGFAVALDIVTHFEQCHIFKKHNFWPSTYYAWAYFKGMYIIMDAASWKWIEFIPMKGFQGFQYMDKEFKVVGDWLMPKPSNPLVLT